MKGYQISFITVQGVRHQGKPLADWLVHLAMDMGIQGATVIAGSEGFGKHRHLHAAHFFELNDQPVEVIVAVTEEESARLFARLDEEKVHVFYVKAPVEFGVLGETGARP